MSKASQDYDVGYGRPPQEHRFRSGQSGNPKGRPRGSHNLQTILSDELQSRVPVVINGRTVKLSKGELAVRQQVDKAAQGDHRAFALLMKLVGHAPFPTAATVGEEGRVVETELTPDQFSEIMASVARDHPPVENGQ